MSARIESTSESDASENENTYCIFLHIVEGIGLVARDGNGDFCGDHLRGKIILNASLNGVKFEVEGHCTETATIFNSNCIWECDLGDIKRMKTDNRPVKLECFVKPTRIKNSSKKLIGSLLLPMRGLQTLVNTSNLNLKLHWHKLGALNSEWRHLKPELFLFLVIVKKSLVESGQLENWLCQRKNVSNDLLSPHISETTLMLQSKNNIYVQLLEQVGLIQVGNNPDLDCDIFNVSFTFKQIKGLERLIESERTFSNFQTQMFVFHYDFLGSVSHLELFVNPSDCYAINEKISLCFKSSLKSLREYFHRIFYIPINLYLNATTLASYNLDLSRFLPDDDFFNTQAIWTKSGSFYFDRLHKILSPKATKPVVDFVFSIQLLQCYSRKPRNGTLPSLNGTFATCERDHRAGGDLVDCYRNKEFLRTIPKRTKRLLTMESLSLSSRNLNSLESMENKCIGKWNSEPHVDGGDMYKDACVYGIESQCVQRYEAENSRLVIYQESEQSTQLTQPIQPVKQTRSVQPTELRVQLTQSTQTFQSAQIITATVCTDTNYLLISPCIKQCSVATETDSDLITEPSPTVDVDEITVKIVQELEEWKHQQMSYFMEGLERKENEYLFELQQNWEQEHSRLRERLEIRIAECEDLNMKLERAQLEFQMKINEKRLNTEIGETIKNDIQRNYADKFKALEVEMKRLQTEMDQKGNLLEQQRKEVQLENVELEKERTELKARIAELEKHLAAVEETHLSANELKEVLSELRMQTDRFASMEKSKDYYKEEWMKATRELSKLKLNILEQQEDYRRDNEHNTLTLCLEEILTEEQEALNSDRSVLKSVKNALFNASDTSSTCGLEDD